MNPPYGGSVLIADTSAWMRAARPVVAHDWDRALVSGQIATCAVTVVEILYSARDGDDYDRKQEGLAELRDVPITRSVTNAALAAYRELAHRAPLHHRSVSIPDLLIAAAAADAGIGVLHYDADYDVLAEVLQFESRWIAPRGSLE